MPRSQYASSTTPPAPTLAVGTGAATQSGTKYVWLYNRTRAGVTLFSPAANITIAPNQSLRITIPSTAKTPASDVRQTGIVLSNDSNPANGAVVATYSGALPATITLDKNAHFAVGVTAQKVVTRATLPTDRVVGMRRYVEGEATILEWTGTDWQVFYPQTLNPYLTDTTGIGGADRALSSLSDTTGVLFPDYDGNGGLSELVQYWIVNDTSLPIPAGVRIGITAAIDALPFAPVPDDSIVKAGLLQLSFLGYANTRTGALDTADSPVTVTYQGNDPMSLALKTDLPPGSAYVLGVQAEFRNFDLHNRAMQGSLIQIYPYFEDNYSIYVPFGRVFGDFILAEGGRRRIVPGGTGLNLKALSGSGVVKSYGFEGVGESPVVGLALNTENQNIVISNNSTCFVAATVGDTTALRAIASMINGVGSATGWSTAVTLGPSINLRVTLNHPTTIRTTYPDVIAGEKAALNARKVRVYVRPAGGGTINYFDSSISGESGEIVLVSGASLGTIAALPTVSQTFGLFDPPTFTPSSVAGTSTLAAGSYEIALAYFYENTVTGLNHSPSVGCIDEWATSFVELLKIQNSWGGTVVPASGQSIEDAIRNIPKILTVDGQTRRVTGNPLIFFDASLTGDEVLSGTWSSRIWRPVWLTSTQPGRWRGEITIKGDKGDTGLKGDKGDIGLTGPPPNLTATANTLTHTEAATAVINGTSPNYTLTLGIPQGTPGTGGTGSGAAPSSYNWLLLDSQASGPQTGSGQLGLFNQSGALRLRQPSSGNAYQLAFVETASQNNVLLNGGFQVAQAATSFNLSSGTAFSHLIDKWQGVAGTGGAATVSQQTTNSGASFFLRWIQSAATSDAPTLRTRIENALTLSGTVCTVSFNAVATANINIGSALVQSYGTGGTPSASVSTSGGTFTVTTTKQRFSFTTVLPVASGTFGTNGDSSLDLVFTFPTGTTFQIDLDSIKLEPGAIASPFQPIPSDRLLPSLYRYLFRVSGATNSLPAFATGRALAANIGTVFVPFPSRMRTLPTFTSNDLLCNANAVTAAAIATNGAGFNGCTIDLTTTVTAAQSVLARLNSAASFVQFDARMPLT